LPLAGEGGEKADLALGEGTLPYEERREGREQRVVPMAEDGALPYEGSSYINVWV